MDGATAVGSFGPCRSHCVRHGRAGEPRRAKLDHRGYDLVDENWAQSERPGCWSWKVFLCLFVVWGFFLVELLPSKEVAVAHVASGICFSRTWFAGKRTDVSCFFLRDCNGRCGLLERLAGSFLSSTPCRARRHVLDCGGMGNPLRLQHAIPRCDRGVGRSTRRTD